MSASSKTPRLKLPKFNGNDPTSWLGDFNGAMDILDGLFNLFYPVGSYYETSDENFDPNTAWGGTWVEDTQGRVTVAQTASGSFNTIGATGGEESHKLTVSEMPSHQHKQWMQFHSGQNRTGDYFTNGCYGWSDGSGPLQIDYALTVQATGGSQAHNNMPPYKVVKRWHRTA